MTTFITSPVSGQASAKKSLSSIIGAILAVLIPPLGLFVSILVWRKSKKRDSNGKGLAIFGTIWGAVFTIPFLFLAMLFVSFGGLKKNAAESDLQPIMARVEQLGGQKICKNGDNGYSIDNTEPWYHIYYQVPDNANLADEIMSAAAQQGYKLHENTDYINQLKGLPGNTGSVSARASLEGYNPKSNYLIAEESGQNMQVEIVRDDEVALRCDSGKYGRNQATTSNHAIVSLYLGLPSTRNK